MLSEEDRIFIEKTSTCIESALERHLGEYGSSLIEHLIIEEISKSFGIKLEKGISLPESLSEARKQSLKESKLKLRNEENQF